MVSGLESCIGERSVFRPGDTCEFLGTAPPFHLSIRDVQFAELPSHPPLIREPLTGNTVQEVDRRPQAVHIIGEGIMNAAESRLAMS